MHPALARFANVHVIYPVPTSAAEPSRAATCLPPERTIIILPRVPRIGPINGKNNIYISHIINNSASKNRYDDYYNSNMVYLTGEVT